MASLPRPHSPYFLVKVSKEKERTNKEKIGSIIIPQTLTFMAYNTQCGEIVGIGEGAAKYFPEAQVGHWLLMHHFVQGENVEDAKEDHLIFDDEQHNYYVVSAYEYAGKGSETYGVWDGEKIIPSKEYVFLEPEKAPVNDLPPDEAINQALQKTESGLFIFKEWKQSREDVEAKQKELKAEVENLAKSGTHKSHIQQGMKEKEMEMDKISKKMNMQKYLPYTVAFANDELPQWFDRPIEAGSVLGMLNMACGTVMTFNDKDYIIAKTKFIAYLFDQKKAA